MPEIPHELIAALPAGAGRTFSELFPEDPGSPELLAGLIRRHLEVVDDASSRGAAVNVDLAHRLADGLLQLVDAWESLAGEARAAVHAAAHYFVLTRDGASDFDSPTGFEDDARVANACFQYIGRPDLQVEI